MIHSLTVFSDHRPSTLRKTPIPRMILPNLSSLLWNVCTIFSLQQNKTKTRKKRYIILQQNKLLFCYKPSLLLSLEESESLSLAPALFCDMMILGAFFKCSLSSSLEQKVNEFPNTKRNILRKIDNTIFLDQTLLTFCPVLKSFH